MKKIYCKKCKLIDRLLCPFEAHFLYKDKNKFIPICSLCIEDLKKDDLIKLKKINKGEKK